MEGDNPTLNRYISMLYRMSKPYFDHELGRFQLGSGQHGFLLHIFKHPGGSFQELAAGGNYDKATATRAVKKLKEMGYVRLEMDSRDRRIQHIYLTKQAEPVMEAAWNSVKEWFDIITDGFTAEEKEHAEDLLERMSGNAHRFMEQFRQEEAEDKIN